MRRRPLLIAVGGAAAAVAAAGWAVRDYRSWRALGPGGLPPTWRGWWRTTRWRLVARDPFAPGPLAPDEAGAPSTLADLPARPGARPRVAPHPVPHRQLTGHAPDGVKQSLARLFADRVRADPVRLCEARSHFEKHVDAVTVREPFRRSADARAACGEVGHVHPSDGSMHMILAPFDARIAIERGWGERHGLAGLRLGLPATYLMIYAPRDAHEAAVAGRLLDAAVAYMASGPNPG